MVSLWQTRAAEAEALGRSLIDLAARLRKDGASAAPAGGLADTDPHEPPQGLSAPRGQPDPGRIVRTVASLQVLRQRRLHHLGTALAGEAAWDILLSLYEARLERRELTFDQLCAVGGAYPATIHRWLSVLSGLGLIALHDPAGHATGQRPSLTRKGELAMTDCLSGLALSP